MVLGSPRLQWINDLDSAPEPLLNNRPPVYYAQTLAVKWFSYRNLEECLLTSTAWNYHCQTCLCNWWCLFTLLASPLLLWHRCRWRDICALGQFTTSPKLLYFIKFSSIVQWLLLLFITSFSCWNWISFVCPQSNHLY